MVTISLLGSHILMHGLPSNKKVEIKNGKYGGNFYHSLIIDGEAAILEGEIPKLVLNNEKIIYVNEKGILQRIAQIINDEKVLIMKMDAIPPGREREILEKLLE